MRRLCLFPLLVVLFGVAPPFARAQDLSLFDAHIHYSQPDWDSLTPEPEESSC